MVSLTSFILLWSLSLAASQNTRTAFVEEENPTLYEGEVKHPSIWDIPYWDELLCLFFPKNKIEGFECLNRFRKISFMAEAIFIEENGGFKFKVNTTKLAILIRNVHKFKESDWFVAAVCFYLTPFSALAADIDTVVRIVGGLMKMPDTDVISDYANSIFKEIIERTTYSVTVVTPNLAIVAWYPFQSDFNGVAWYRGYNSTSDGYIQKISPNWTVESINKDNLIMALYVPNGFIETLTANSELNELRDVFIILTMAKENVFLLKEFDGKIYDIVSIKVPGFCKTNELPILKVLYEDDARVYEYGNEYFDPPNGLPQMCMLSGTTYFARIRNGVNFFESAKAGYCLRYRNGNTYFSQAPRNYPTYPEDFCVNRNAEIPYLKCDIQKPSGENIISRDLKCENNYSISAHTHKIYKFATQCWSIKNFSDVLIEMSSANLETIDKKMLFDVLLCIIQFKRYVDRTLTILRELDKDNDAFLNGINTALGFLKELPKELIKATTVSDVLVEWMFLMFAHGQNIRNADDNYIYQQTSQDSLIIGMVVYRRGSGSFKDYEVKPLTKDNATKTHALDQSVEVVIYVSNWTNYSFTGDYGVAFLYLLYTRPSLKYENNTITPQSRSLVVYSLHERDFEIFLRVIDSEDKWMLNYYTGEGYWFRTSVLGAAFTHIVKTTTRNYCESLKNVEILNYAYRNQSIHALQRKTTNKKIDLLSMLSMSVNTAEGKTRTEEIYNKHSLLIKIFRMLGSTFSLLGVTILFTTALALKNWHKTRFYTIQLAITLTFQVVFFIAETQIDEIHQVGFFIFYYCILSQFFWMSLIAYVQYMRYIKVFQSRKVGVVKSLIIGWLFPAIVTASSLIFYSDCLRCDLCYKNKDIFIFFVLVPMGVVVAVNLIVYIFAMINIWSNQGGVSLASDRKLKIRASIFLPFLMGITWLFVFAVLSPWSWLFVAGLLFIHLIVPSQAIILCVFVVLLDKPTRQQWKSQIRDILKKRK